MLHEAPFFKVVLDPFWADQKHSKTQLYTALGALWGPGGRNRYGLERSILRLFLALPEPHRSLVNYEVRSTFSLHFRNPVRDHIRCTFSRFSKNARGRKARYLQYNSDVLGTCQGGAVEAKKGPFFTSWDLRKSDLFRMEASQMRQIAIGSQVRSKTHLWENSLKGGPFRAPPRGSRRRKDGKYQYLSTLADGALWAVLTRFEDPQNRALEAEVSCFAGLAAW